MLRSRPLSFLLPLGLGLFALVQVGCVRCNNPPPPAHQPDLALATNAPPKTPPAVKPAMPDASVAPGANLTGGPDQYKPPGSSPSDGGAPRVDAAPRFVPPSPPDGGVAPPNTKTVQEQEAAECRKLAAGAEAGKAWAKGSVALHGDASLRARLLVECQGLQSGGAKACEALADEKDVATCKSHIETTNMLFKYLSMPKEQALNQLFTELRSGAEECKTSPAECDVAFAAVRNSKPGDCPARPPSIAPICVALASADPNKCPDGAGDCPGITELIAAIQRGGGVAGMAEGSRTTEMRVFARAATGAKDACAPMVAALAKACAAP